MPVETPRFKIPYPSEREDPFYTAFQSMVLFLDQLNFGQHEDLNSIVYSDGIVGWSESSGVYKLSLYGDVIFVSPTFGREETFPVAAPPLEIQIPVNHYLVFDLTRGATAPVDLTSMYSVQTQLPVDSTSRILCYHAPNHKLYFTTNLVLSVGGTSTGLAPSSSGGATTFLGLTDTPSAFTGESLKAVRVNVGETALEFYTPSPGTGGSIQTIAVPFDFSSGTFNSTRTVPDGGVVMRAYCRIDTPFTVINTITVELAGAVTLMPLMDASDIDADDAGVNEVAVIGEVDSDSAGTVKVSVLGTLSVGEGVVYVDFIEAPLT